MHGHVQADTAGQPASEQVGGHAEEFIQQEQGGHFQRTETKAVEEQHHQHAQGAVGEGEGPVAEGDQQILGKRIAAQGQAHRGQRLPTFMASSIMRCT